MRNAHRDEFKALYDLQAEQIKQLQRDQTIMWDTWGPAKSAAEEKADVEYQEGVQVRKPAFPLFIRSIRETGSYFRHGT